jgi:clan AA aspartic protease
VFSRPECQPFRGSYEVRVTLTHPLTGASINLKSVVDTGFSGPVLVESAAYRELGLDLVEKPSVEFPVYRGLLGSVVMRSSYGKATIGGRDLPTEILTPLYGPGRNLIGRKLLREFTTLLHREEMTCIGEAEVEK